MNLDHLIDAGGYIAEWTSKIIINYGSKSIIFEPVAEYFSKCNELFGLNNRIILYNNGIGSSNELRRFYLSDVGTSEYSSDRTLPYVDVNTLDINEFINELINDKTIKATNGSIGCMKVNIEGGEYELLERLIETDKLRYFRCLLIQFHRNPSDWTDRKNAIVSKLELTHRNVWRFEMVWERWDIIS
jgi:FkbM family methyltransferase